MRIVIDMQGAQSSGSRNRGIGRYTLALSKAMTRLRGENEVVLALNGLFPDTIEPIRAAFCELLPEENIAVWEAAGSVNALDPSNEARRRAAELVREGFLASLRPDIVLLTSLFEGLEDDAVTSIGSFAYQLPTAVILYDLIPYIHRDIYLQNPLVEHWYLNKLDHLRRADLLLSISASSGREAIDYLGVPSANSVNISTACDSHFRPIAVDQAKQSYLHKTYGLVRPFVMYTGGIDHRKNIEGLIRAYARLPKKIRLTYQLAVVCSIQAPDRERLLQLAENEGLGGDELVITGFVPEENLLALYNLCTLFVFPSWHEGFGLPALEAMACGRAVIGANTSSVPEVIDREDALFDPFDDKSIARKIEEVLTDDHFRTELEHHGLVQAEKFSWEQTAQCAWDALNTLVSVRKRMESVQHLSNTPRRPRLAYISPLPPEQSGISDYSAELLPQLARYYEIEVIVAQGEVAAPWVQANCPIRTVEWFRANARRFDRMLYHFGNSPFHSHMFHLLAELPGAVVLHDFYLSHIVGHLDYLGITSNGWDQALVNAHGWPALQSRYQDKNTPDEVYAYPCNLSVLQQSLGVIVHSGLSCRLAQQWYGSKAADDWSVIPLLRVPVVNSDRHAVRQDLGLTEREFVVCSFGLLGAAKLNHRLLAAWLASPLADDPRCHLVFVGQNNSGEYGDELVRAIRDSAAVCRIKITGWVDAENYRRWLAAADIGVQLRTLSRGETSAAVLDCMNHGLATIVNANGSMADLPTDAVWMLPDEFSDEQMIDALTTLWCDVDRRTALGTRAHEVIKKHHQPRWCAEQYAQAIESYYQKAAVGGGALIDAIAKLEPPLSHEDWPTVATTLAHNLPPRPRRKQLFLDISILVQHDAKSGIQRVVRALLREYLISPPEGWAVEPVYATSDSPGYLYARCFTSRFLDVHDDWAEDSPVDAWPGDIFVGLDLQHVVVPLQRDFLLGWRRRDIKVFFVVYDLLPVLLPQYFPDGTQEMHQHWLESISYFDGLVCISRAVADELYDWLQTFGPKRERPLAINWFHLGADVENTVPTSGLPDNADQTLNALRSQPSFLAVGTIEPRKGYDQTLAAFDQLWQEGVDANLIIVGKQGWKMELLITKICDHREFGKRLLWFEGISDEFLEKLYTTSTCLIAASEGEGFGLPLIEAAQHGLSIIARDIPVFHEVAGEHAYYFADDTVPTALAVAIKEWLTLSRRGVHPRSEAMPCLTWKQSARQLLDAITGAAPYKNWLPDETLRYWGNDPRLFTQVGKGEGRFIRTNGQAGLLVFGPYALLQAGRYRIVVYGTASHWARQEWFDVAYDKGERHILHAKLEGLNIGKWRYEAEFVLETAADDLEFRVWVADSSRLTLNGIELVSVTEAPTPYMITDITQI